METTNTLKEVQGEYTKGEANEMIISNSEVKGCVNIKIGGKFYDFYTDELLRCIRNSDNIL